ncbi:MAG: prolyl oligopeptidase family serine peptidase [Melioribacteraceae bacterium]|nr:prolyl oligopeptidase family serine peptidase [Melioribacteraceae bacterium]MCF8355778.1 prolyl oligopeptidase family serine peptidase [Melioribacteraceae bacterium]MCF8392832.1 prolyl oligopeptidase family serine peptidase [Melioribacteraceae bacterium]MCF8418682.1 prolyl oligopeptidase family serine peptidase [Melioribacteraceae bacterium]
MIIEREKIELSKTQKKIAASGWGESAIENTTVEKITYESDGLKVKGYLAYPNDTSAKYPCIIWNRGGIGNAGAIDEFNASGIFGQLAGWGYVVFASQYRGNAGGEGKDEFGGDDINDILNLMPLAEEIEHADSSIWGIEGWSRGGMMTYLALTRNHNFKAAVISGGIANLRCNSEESRFMKKLYEVTMGKYGSEDFNKKCNSRSIVNFADKLPETTPLLIMHGTNDKRVLPHDSLDLSYKLLENNIPFRLIMLEGGDHFLKSHRKEVDAYRKFWFDKYLKPEEN